VRNIIILVIFIVNFSSSYCQKYEYQLTKLTSDTLLSIQPFSNPIFLTFKLLNNADIKIEIYKIINSELENNSLKETSLIKTIVFNNIESGSYLFSWNYLPDSFAYKSTNFICMIFLDSVLYKREIFTIIKS